ncbi:hypothetical protein M409DRAFT_62418 [Zasmidium cellare ATCC 36951]|uniref:Amino acid permease/ SLC12A domain-containing protein n=1 Tax=Zasmidium cellare ATCC 36951 TaxID=1080233 RepID=A0A6A6D3B1_ZASCE|nr:uncharacterized protein M409DRAFT_62418 [Zasmidium cellare ATCC 36951]KAF2172672.1 hypothetical protein M409DRAFT_62418 [Zasmidium cellare ATCC 36951]
MLFHTATCSSPSYNGGPQVFIWSCLISWIGVLAQAASMAEMASLQPIAGAQYHWTWAFAPIRMKRFLTWLQGWLTWFGWISLLCGIVNVTAGLLLSLVNLCIPEYSPKDWHLYLTIVALAVTQAACNIFAWKVLPAAEVVAGWLHLLLFIVFVGVLGGMGSKHSADYVFTHFEVSSGWAGNRFVAWNLGMLSTTWSLTFTQSLVLTAPSTCLKKFALTIALNGVLGFAMVIALLFPLGPLEEALEAEWPILAILLDTTGSVQATTALMSLLIVVSYFVGVAATATVSRLTWTWSRDGGLHPRISVVSQRFPVPVAAVILPTVLVILHALLGLGSSAAFGAIIALSSLALYVSYFIAIACMVWTRLSQPLELGTWNLGRWGLMINLFAVVYTLWIIIFLPWPSSVPVTGAGMNYASPIFAFCALFVLTTWLFWARTHWNGVSGKVVEYVLTSEE